MLPLTGKSGLRGVRHLQALLPLRRDGRHSHLPFLPSPTIILKNIQKLCRA